MKEIGVEVEAFIADKEGKVVEPRKIGLPIDDCGFLAEVRTESHTESYLLAAEIYKELNSLKKRVLEQGYDILDNHVYKPTSKERRHFALEYGKEYETVYSIYTTEDRMSFEKRTWTAGLHVHFSNINTLKTEKQTIQIPSIINIPQIIRKLDNIFKDEIKESKREKGLYRMKPWGFEYRSLPASLMLNKSYDEILKIVQVFFDVFADA